MNSPAHSHSSLKLAVFSLLFASGAAFAQAPADPAPVPGHPRVNEVDQRLDNQQNRVQHGVAGGQINAKHEARDEKHISHVEQRESRDEAAHGGHLTKGEQRHLNRSLNKNSHRVHRQRH
jgi:hypothetical protein